MTLRQLARFCASCAIVLSVQVPALAQSTTTPQTLVIGVDHVDLANQQPQNHRVFEYTDFFSREVSVHTDDTLDFQASPASLHVVALAANEPVARKVYPVTFADSEDPIVAPGTGLSKIGLGPSNFSITNGSLHGGGTISNNPNGPPVCGVIALGEAPCTFSGGDDVEVAGPNPGFNSVGQPAAVDWLINIQAPPGKYHFFCYLHPGMNGTLNVVAPSQPTTTQAQINEDSQEQFRADRAAALETERAANEASFSGGAPGTRTYFVHVGVGAPDNRVAIDEMLPRQALDLVPGDQVKYLWNDPHNVHTVTFPTGSPSLPPPFGFDCGSTFSGIPCNDPKEGAPELSGDPGNAPSGSILTTVTALIDSGLLIGKGYHVTPSAQSWSAVVSGISAPGAFQYQCIVHDWMQGTINVGSGH
jgi:plastocyanin